MSAKSGRSDRSANQGAIHSPQLDLGTHVIENSTISNAATTKADDLGAIPYVVKLLTVTLDCIIPMSR